VDKDTQKKAMIGGLAVLILGAGSYFFLAGGSDNAATANSAGPAAAPRQREVKKNTESKARTRERPKEAAEVAEVRTRAEPTERARGPVRERRDNTRKIEKKKEIKPAA
jgi:hypothetical protein